MPEIIDVLYIVLVFGITEMGLRFWRWSTYLIDIFLGEDLRFDPQTPEGGFRCSILITHGMYGFAHRVVRLLCG